MIERDYVLRMIQMLASVLSKLLFLKNSRKYDEALAEIDEAGQRFIGMKWVFLRNLSIEQLIDLLGRERQLDKMFAMAELLREESEILADKGNPDESVLQGMKAFSLFAGLVADERSFLKVMSVNKFDALLKKLEEYELPPQLDRKRFRYYEIVGKFAAAEDVLFDILPKDPTIRNEGVAFYKRLLGKPDQELNEGGLPREEVVLGLDSLMSKS